MKPLRASTLIAAPVEQVFEVFSDFRNIAGRVQAITRLDVLGDQPIGVGTIFRETRLMFGKQATEEMTVTEFDPPRQYTLEADSCGCHYRARHEFHPDAKGTRVEVVMTGQPLSYVGKFMGWVWGWMMAGPMQQCVEKDLLDLKQFLETPR